jgi:hypothetical protein
MLLDNKLRSLTALMSKNEEEHRVCLTKKCQTKSKGQTYRQPSMRCSHGDSSSRCFRRVGDKRISLTEDVARDSSRLFKCRFHLLQLSFSLPITCIVA